MVMAMGGGGDGTKNRLGLRVDYVLAIQHLTQGRVVVRTERLVRDLDGKVQIADLPSQHSDGLRRGRQGDLEHGLGILEDRITHHLIPKDYITMRQGMIQVEPKLTPIARDRPPSSLRQSGSVNHDGYGILLG